MLAEERFSTIIRLLEQKNSVSVPELTALFGVSESTVRRDLSEMNDLGYLKKVHGGATSIKTHHITYNDNLSVRATKNMDVKRRMAQYAAQLITTDDFVFLDSGTSIDVLVDVISVTNCHFVTNNLSSACKLAAMGNFVHILGGSLDPTISATIGADTYIDLKKYNFTLGFFGVNGIHRHSGFSTPFAPDAIVKQEAIRRCKNSYIIADPSKFDCVANVTFASLSDASIITTEVPDVVWRTLATVIEVDRLSDDTSV